MSYPYIGALCAGAFIIPVVYWTNRHCSAYLPINTNTLYTNQGLDYDVSQILTNNVINEKNTRPALLLIILPPTWCFMALSSPCILP